MVDADRIPHAILFSGPAGVGKMMMARAFAQYVHCSSRNAGEPCGICPSCRQHLANSNPDLHFIYPVVKKKLKAPLSTDYIEEWRKMIAEEPFMRRDRWLALLDAGNSQPIIYVSEAEEIARTAPLSSFASRYKIYLIWLPEAMNPETANKLLKILEEPWDDTIFLMVSNNPEKLLPTVYSRTQRILFRPLEPQQLEKILILQRGVEKGIAERISRISEGSLFKAEDLMQADGETEESAEWFRTIMRSAYARKMKRLLQLSDEIADKGRERVLRFLNYGAMMVRENYIYNLRQPLLNAMTLSEEQFATRFAPFINHKNVEGLAAEFTRASNEIARNANARIVLFDMFINITRYIRLQ